MSQDTSGHLLSVRGTASQPLCRILGDDSRAGMVEMGVSDLLHSTFWDSLNQPPSVKKVFFFLLTIRSQGSWRNPYGIPTDPWQLNSLLPSSTKNLPAMGATSLHPVVNMVSTSWGSPAIAVARAAGHPAVHGWCPESIADSDVESVEHPGRISSHQFQYTIQRKLWLLIEKPPAGDVASLQKASNMTAVM